MVDSSYSMAPSWELVSGVLDAITGAPYTRYAVYLITNAAPESLGRFRGLAHCTAGVDPASEEEIPVKILKLISPLCQGSCRL